MDEIRCGEAVIGGIVKICLAGFCMYSGLVMSACLAAIAVGWALVNINCQGKWKKDRVKNMRKAVVYAVALTLGISLCMVGCKGGGDTEKKAEDMDETLDEGMSEPLELTEEEKKILLSLTVNESHVEKGDLFLYEVEYVMQMRYGKEYLEKKYPSYSFHYVMMEPKNKINPYTTIDFSEDGIEEYFEMHIYTEDEENSSYQAADSFYGSLIRKDYESLVLDQVKMACEDAFVVYANIAGVYDDDYTEALSLEELLENKKMLRSITQIYVDGQGIDEAEYEALSLAVKEQLEAQRLSGTFTICFLKRVPDDYADSNDLTGFVKSLDNKEKFKYAYSLYYEEEEEE